MSSIVALLWTYLIKQSAHPHHHHTRTDAWSAVEMATIMMAAMMLPAILPALLHIAQRSHAPRRTITAILGFSCGYLTLWTAFATLTALAPFEQTDKVSAAALLVLAGAHQMSAAKSAYLSRCCTLAACKRAAALDGSGAALISGLRHGLACLACCWTLMLLMFIHSTMNIAWMAIITLYLLWERFASPRRAVIHGVGLALIVYGIALAL